MTGPVFCTYCGQKFSRNEHLERHVITHTNVKPFKCELCHSSFNRQDLFKRHLRVLHRNGQSTPTDPIIRTPIACVACAKAKARCDKEDPCFRCKRKGIECQPRTSTRIRDHSHTRIRARSERATSTATPSSSPTPLSWQQGPHSVGDLHSSFSTPMASPYLSEIDTLEYMPTPPPLESLDYSQFPVVDDFSGSAVYPFFDARVVEDVTSVPCYPSSSPPSSSSSYQMMSGGTTDQTQFAQPDPRALALFIPWLDSHVAAAAASATPAPESVPCEIVDVEPLYSDGWKSGEELVGMMAGDMPLDVDGSLEMPMAMEADFTLYAEAMQEQERRRQQMQRMVAVPAGGGWEYSEYMMRR